MGLSSFPTAAEGMLPVLVLNTVLSLAVIKNTVRALLKVFIGADYWAAASDYDQDSDGFPQENIERAERRVSITQVKSLCHSGTSWVAASSSSYLDECCVCLCGFEAEEEVTELSCKHFFHKGCLDKWFDNKHSTCPLCRSIY